MHIVTLILLDLMIHVFVEAILVETVSTGQPDALFSPVVPPRSLPLENLYVQRIQSVYSLLDWLAERLTGWLVPWTVLDSCALGPILSFSNPARF